MTVLSYPHLTGPALVARINELSAGFACEAREAFAAGVGREDDVLTLLLVDSGVYGRNPAMDQLRAELGLPDPVLPSAREHGELSRRLYTVRDHGTASATAIGG